MEDKNTSLLANGFYPKLNDTLSELGKVTKNKLAVESKVRPTTVNEIANGSAKQINFVTLNKIINGLNDIAAEKGIDKQYNVEDVFQYDYKKDHQS